MPAGLLRPGAGYAQIPLANFSGGLNLAAGSDDPDIIDSGQAIDLLNVVFTQLGAVKQRYGYERLGASALTNRPDSIAGVFTSSGTKRLLVGNGQRIDALDNTGASVANTTAPTASPHYFARFGTPTSETVFIANGTDTVRRYTPATDVFDVPTYTGTTPTGKYLGTFDGRLACACTSTNPSRVLFSDRGTPTTFGANNYADLDPGDGEAIQGMASWGSYLFVFKNTKFYVFTNGTSDGQGNPVFNFYPVYSNVGCVGGNAIAAAPDGLYFLDRKGVYRTQGKAPTQLSQLIDPFFVGNTAIYFKSSAANLAQIQNAAMTWFNQRLYVTLATGGSSAQNRMLVYDTRYGWWSLFDIPASCLTVWRPANADELLFGFASGTNDIGRYSDNSGYTADNMSNTGTGGSAISARWRSGWFTYYFRYRGRWFPDLSVHVVRQCKIFGEGQVLVQLSKDYRSDLDTGTTVTFGTPASTWGSHSWNDGTLWGPTGTTRPHLVRGIAIRGTVISIELSNSTLNQAFTVHQIETHLKGPSRRPTVVETED